MGEAELYAGRRREADDVTNLNQINSQRQLLRVFGGLNEGLLWAKCPAKSSVQSWFFGSRPSFNK